MFITKSKAEIGQYLSYLIVEKGYKSDRQFGIEYLKLRDGGKYPENEIIQNMANRICQMKKGKKEIQLEDLPLFSELLGVSIEEILSAGTFLAPATSRLTNYSIAFSDNPEEWIQYIERNDKLILNPDEYNKTVIDYALEAKNYAFLKYLVENKYIWFVSDNQREYGLGFGAGTSIKRREFGHIDILDTRLKESDNLRFKMIALAINNEDFPMLSVLHAREIPELYMFAPMVHYSMKGKTLPVSRNMATMIKSIASSKSKDVLQYFFDDFEIRSSTIKQVRFTFVFPYIDLLLKEMIKNNPKKAQRFLEKAIQHNKSVNLQVLKAIDESMKRFKEIYPDKKDVKPTYRKQLEKSIKTDAWKDYYFYPENGFICFFPIQFKKHAEITGFVINVVHVEAKSSNPDTQYLIDTLNQTYDSFASYLKNKENE